MGAKVRSKACAGVTPFEVGGGSDCGGAGGVDLFWYFSFRSGREGGMKMGANAFSKAFAGVTLLELLEAEGAETGAFAGEALFELREAGARTGGTGSHAGARRGVLAGATSSALAEAGSRRGASVSSVEGCTAAADSSAASAAFSASFFSFSFCIRSAYEPGTTGTSEVDAGSSGSGCGSSATGGGGGGAGAGEGFALKRLSKS
mmetsp:Transcript_19608/g.46975  ORF Transcript_19608/g.46975 Transcript_19608/m.46975 type:complete len:204 (-) Transcript_19608:297-908(-)